jgi:hypothetical protein
MRRTAWLAVAATCFITAASGCGAAQGSAGPQPSSPRPAARARTATATGNVPWADNPAPVYTPPIPPPPPSPVAQYAPCKASQLVGRLIGSAPGAAQVTTTLLLSNAGKAPCTIDAGPNSAAGILTDGTTQPLTIGSPIDGLDNLVGPPANLRPGRSAQVVISSVAGTGFCSDSHTYSLAAMAIGVGTGTVRITFPPPGPAYPGPLTLYTCGSQVPIVADFGTPGPSQTPPPSSLDVLTVSRSMPATVTPGTTADYAVTLTNPTRQAVKLSPCPSYEEFIAPTGTKPGQDASYYYLNCQAAPSIPAHGKLTFDMEIQVPAGVGQAKYGWLLQGTSVETGGVTALAP